MFTDTDTSNKYSFIHPRSIRQTVWCGLLDSTRRQARGAAIPGPGRRAAAVGARHMGRSSGQHLGRRRREQPHPHGPVVRRHPQGRGRGAIENKHSTDVASLSPLPPLRVCMSIHPEGTWYAMLQSRLQCEC